ncbi:MAG: DUF262 domain-containing protein [Eubacteriales bacterium]|nr:DUF262 domain-containing protein [Eubacteriales bacterium]
MKVKNLPLKEVSIQDLFNGNIQATYEVPIYQRNFAWEKDEITALIQDICDAWRKDSESVYYIGTLVSFHKGENVFEIIDGQQRLTTLTLIQDALNVPMQNRLTYRARRKATNTLNALSKEKTDIDEADRGIVAGFGFVKTAISEKLSEQELDGFKKYFQNKVHIIHYQVPRDIDLNRYFEIMNSRGEQLEKHEIVKAKLLAVLHNPADRSRFNRVWECCSDMSLYIQQKYPEARVFGESLDQFISKSFEELPADDVKQQASISIESLLASDTGWQEGKPVYDDEQLDAFQPIIDFSNFLLIVLKLTRIREEEGFVPTSFNLDDKELLDEFGKLSLDEAFVKRFGYNLLKAKFLLDNYMIHHSKEEDCLENNPWKLQRWQRDKRKKGYLKNLVPDEGTQIELQHLLSMFEVSFTARQRKNYLFYCLLYLFDLPSYAERIRYLKWYCWFVQGLADKYFRNVYLVSNRLNEINTPLPGSFDDVILQGSKVNKEDLAETGEKEFITIYGDGTEKSRGIPLFVFNYLDYKIWRRYAWKLRGGGAKKGSKQRKEYFDELGCSDFDLKVFDQFYFSRTRRSLEHYYPQANANGLDGAPDENQINCLGNFAMIGSEANSSGSNWSPKTKLDHYLDPSGKIKQVGVASIKFMIMMQRCKDNQESREPGQEWVFEDIKDHQERMLKMMLK